MTPKTLHLTQVKPRSHASGDHSVYFLNN